MLKWVVKGEDKKSNTLATSASVRYTPNQRTQITNLFRRKTTMRRKKPKKGELSFLKRDPAGSESQNVHHDATFDQSYNCECSQLEQTNILARSVDAQVATELQDLSDQLNNYNRQIQRRKRSRSERISERDAGIRKRLASVQEMVQDFVNESQNSTGVISAYLEEGFAFLDKLDDGYASLSDDSRMSSMSSLVGYDERSSLSSVCSVSHKTSTPLQTGTFVRPSTSSMGVISEIDEEERDDDDVFMEEEGIEFNSDVPRNETGLNTEEKCLSREETTKCGHVNDRTPLKRNLIFEEKDSSTAIPSSYKNKNNSPCGVFKRQKCLRMATMRRPMRLVTPQIAHEIKDGKNKWSSTRDIILNVIQSDKRESTFC